MLAAVAGGALEQLDPGRRRRRTWSTEGRAHVEVRGLDLPQGSSLAEDLEATLCCLHGVAWAEVNMVLGRVVVAYDPDGPTLEDLVQVIQATECRHAVGGQRFPKERPEHPADIEGLRRAVVGLGADVAGVWVSAFGQLLRATPFPVELASLVSLADQQRRVRAVLERLGGTPAADL